MPEREHPQAFALHEAAKVRDRNAGHAIDRLDVVELERIDKQVEAIGQRLRRGGFARRRVDALGCCGHSHLTPRKTLGGNFWLCFSARWGRHRPDGKSTRLNSST